MNNLTKTVTAPNGLTLGFHQVRRVEVSADGATAHVLSWPSEAAYIEGKPPGYAWPVAVPIAEEVMFSALTQVLLSSTFGNASQVPDNLDTLDAAKARRWAYIKGKRDEAEFGSFTWNEIVFDADLTSQLRISGCAGAAGQAVALGQEFTVDWTTASNAVVTLQAFDMIGVGQALLVHVGTCHAIGRALRQAIEAAQDVPSVEAIEWPAP